MLFLLTPAFGTAPPVACLILLGDDLTVRCIDWRVSSGEERCMTAAAGDWFAVPRRGRVEEAVGVALVLFPLASHPSPSDSSYSVLMRRIRLAARSAMFMIGTGIF
jgi:hypothetical protein